MKTPNCSKCGHTAATHRNGISHCRQVIQSKWTGGREEKQPSPDAVWHKYAGWECGCRVTLREIEGTLGPVCRHCGGTGHEPK